MFAVSVVVDVNVNVNVAVSVVVDAVAVCCCCLCCCLFLWLLVPASQPIYWGLGVPVQGLLYRRSYMYRGSYTEAPI